MGIFCKGDAQFQDPEHLAVDPEGNVYVSDRKRDDIQKFVPISETNSSNGIINTSTSNNLISPSSSSSSQKETP